MTSCVKEIIGKTITGVITKVKCDGGTYPRSQVFLVFDDNTYYEFYCLESEIFGIKGLARLFHEGALKQLFHYHCQEVIRKRQKYNLYFHNRLHEIVYSLTRHAEE